MKHDWRRHPESYSPTRPFQSWRVCQNCKVEQKRESHSVWGRVTSYRWRPLAGRCKK